MTLKFLLAVSTLLACSFTFRTADTEVITERRNGNFIVYLDERINPCEKEESYFYGYNYFENGKAVWKYYKSAKKDSVVSDTNGIKKGQPVLLNQTIRKYRYNGFLVSKEEYRKGKPYFFDSQNGPNGLIEKLYFYKTYKNQTGSYFYEIGMPGSLKTFWYRKGKRGWKSYPA